MLPGQLGVCALKPCHCFLCDNCACFRAGGGGRAGDAARGRAGGVPALPAHRHAAAFRDGGAARHGGAQPLAHTHTLRFAAALLSEAQQEKTQGMGSCATRHPDVSFV